MAIDPERFNELFSELSNNLQAALFLAGQRATAARAEAAESDQLFNAIARAAEAARRLRSNGGEPA